MLLTVAVVSSVSLGANGPKLTLPRLRALSTRGALVFTLFAQQLWTAGKTRFSGPGWEGPSGECWKQRYLNGTKTRAGQADNGTRLSNLSINVAGPVPSTVSEIVRRQFYSREKKTSGMMEIWRVQERPERREGTISSTLSVPTSRGLNYTIGLSPFEAQSGITRQNRQGLAG